ncbi:hypothetical protein ABTM92_19680, partial [Acinetobacter baumannii]
FTIWALALDRYGTAYQHSHVAMFLAITVMGCIFCLTYLPRAAHIDHEGMRVLQEAGAADAVFATSRRVARYDFRNAKGRVLLRFDGS